MPETDPFPEKIRDKLAAIRKECAGLKANLSALERTKESLALDPDGKQAREFCEARKANGNDCDVDEEAARSAAGSVVEYYRPRIEGPTRRIVGKMQDLWNEADTDERKASLIESGTLDAFYQKKDSTPAQRDVLRGQLVHEIRNDPSGEGQANIDQLDKLVAGEPLTDRDAARQRAQSPSKREADIKTREGRIALDTCHELARPLDTPKTGSSSPVPER